MQDLMCKNKDGTQRFAPIDNETENIVSTIESNTTVQKDTEPEKLVSAVDEKIPTVQNHDVIPIVVDTQRKTILIPSKRNQTGIP